MKLSNEEMNLLIAVQNSKRFPIVRFELHCSNEKSVVSTALNHVWITDPQDSMDAVKARGAVIQSLIEKELIQEKFALKAWVASDYKIYYQSKLYEMLCHMVLEASKRPDFLFDTPYMKRGMITLTQKGKKALS